MPMALRLPLRSIYNKNLDELTTARMAMISGLPKARQNTILSPIPNALLNAAIG